MCSFSTPVSLLQTAVLTDRSALLRSPTFLSFNLPVLFLPLSPSPPHPRSCCTSCPSSLRKTTSTSCSNTSAARRAWTKKGCTRRPHPSGSARAASGRLGGRCPPPPVQHQHFYPEAALRLLSVFLIDRKFMFTDEIQLIWDLANARPCCS